MYAKTLARCATLSFRKVLCFGILLATLIEGITVVLRFGLDMQSTRDTGAIGQWTFGLRVHHGYIGVFVLLVGWCFPLGLRHALWIIAFGLILSDLAHHFLVLWPITGSPQFDLVYPPRPTEPRP